MRLIAFALGGICLLAVLCLWLITQLQYRIGERHLKITLFGIPMRRVALTDIKRISKRRPTSLSEWWCNTLTPGHRTLTIQRRSGLRKSVIITPLNRYIFLKDLERAIQRATPLPASEPIIEESPEETEA